MRTEWIPLSACIHKGLYQIDARNFSCGVFDSETNGFIGIRRKFGDTFLDTEYHYDHEEGTAQPIKFIESCTVNLEDEKSLFEYIDIKGKELKQNKGETV